MKKIVLVAFAITVSLVSCSDDDNNSTVVEEIIPLSQEEINDLLFSREEEKLARDVYLYSYDKYGDAIFGNISQSEQRHMDQILTLLNTYQLTDPASPDRGVFSNQVLQDLYTALVAQSDISLVEALTVGAIIEDLDIKDLQDLESRTTHSDILTTYDKLKCGSRNHMRNFNTQLVANGVDYLPQYITLAEFTDIISSSNEQCNQ